MKKAVTVSSLGSYGYVFESVWDDDGGTHVRVSKGSWSFDGKTVDECVDEATKHFASDCGFSLPSAKSVLMETYDEDAFRSAWYD